MEVNSISPELQEEIQDKVRNYRAGLSGLRYAGELAMAYADGIAEYASKLHLLQQEYDKLKGDYEQYVQDFDNLFNEHAALKVKAEKMADLLKYIRNNSSLSLFAKAEIDGLLSSYNSNTNQPNVYIGNPKGYCHDCGFPVDECNCESNTNQNENNGN